MNCLHTSLDTYGDHAVIIEMYYSPENTKLKVSSQGLSPGRWVSVYFCHPEM